MGRAARWLRVLVLAGLLASSLFGLALWRLSRDDQRLTAWLAESVQSAIGLRLVSAPGHFGFWPRLSVVLEQVQLQSKDRQVPIAARLIALELPWSSLFGSELAIGRVKVDGVLIDRKALAAWLLALTELGPPPPLRWPRIDSPVEITGLSSFETGNDAPLLIVDSLRLDHWQIDQAARIEAEIRLPALEKLPLRVRFTLTPRQTPNAIAVEPVSGSIEDADGAKIELQGFLSIEDLAHLDVQLRLLASQLPSWLPTGPARFEPAASDLTLRFTGAADGPAQCTIAGSLAGSAIEAELLLPYRFTEFLTQGDLVALAEQTGGSLRLERMRIGAADLRGISWQGAVAESAAATVPAAKAPE